MRPKMRGAPSQPSLSWIAATPRVFARRIPSRVAATHSSSVTVTNRSRNRQADSSRRIPVGVPAFVTLDDAARDLEIPTRTLERGRVEPERVVVLRPERCRRLPGHCVERRRRRLLRPVGVAPPAAADPGAPRAVSDPRECLRQRGHACERDLALRKRPRREVHVAVGECRQHAAAAEVDTIGSRQRPLVRPDAPRNEVTGDCEGARAGERGVHRAHDAVREDHPAITVLSLLTATGNADTLDTLSGIPVADPHLPRSALLARIRESVIGDDQVMPRPLRHASRDLRGLHGVRARARLPRGLHPRGGPAPLRQHPHRVERDGAPDHPAARGRAPRHPRGGQRRRARPA